MPIPLAAASVTVTAAVAVVAATETIIATLPAISPPMLSPTIRLFGVLRMTTAALTTAVTLRIRRGTAITGVLVGTADAVIEAASTLINMTTAGEDSPGEVAGQQYVLTAQATGPAANGSATFAELIAMVF